MRIEGDDDGPRLAGSAAPAHLHGTTRCEGGSGCGADHLTGAAREAVIPVTLEGRLAHLEMQLSVESLNVRAISHQVSMLINDIRRGLV